MAIISDSTFNPLRAYVNVRLQQGVPIVDADINELDDIRKFELRAFLKWFVGDGVPEGNGGFRIVGGLDNDFTITAGAPVTADIPDHDVALRHAGRIVVDGLDVIIKADCRFTAQSLHIKQRPEADALAARLGVPVVAALETPTRDGVVCAYLDVWERMVTPDDEPSLVHAGLGVETCARRCREWVVRVRDGDAPPSRGDSDFREGHAYTALATIRRRKDDSAVRPGDISDRQHRRLLLPPATLIHDVLGQTPDDYRAGRGRPPISLRDAVNALLHGQLPASGDSVVDSSPGVNVNVIGRAFTTDANGGLAAVWHSDRHGGTNQIFAARADLAAPSALFDRPQRVTANGAHQFPHVVALPTGDLVIAYQGVAGDNADIFLKQATFDGLAEAEERPVARTPAVEGSPFLTLAGSLVTVFWHAGSNKRWMYRRWDHAKKEWKDENPRALSNISANQSSGFHAAVDGQGKIWTAFGAVDQSICVVRLDPSTGTADSEKKFSSQSLTQSPFVVCGRGGDIWVFWETENKTILTSRLRAGQWESQVVPGAQPRSAGRGLSAIEDVDQGIWLFYSGGSDKDNLFTLRWDPPTGVWGTPGSLTTTGSHESRPFALVLPDTSVRVFWSRKQDGDENIYHKRLITSV